MDILGEYSGFQCCWNGVSRGQSAVDGVRMGEELGGQIMEGP